MEARDDFVVDTNPSGPPGAARSRQKWALTQEAFDKLLACLDPDRETAGKKYLEIRGNLLRFFEWRGCPFPEDHADETVNRVAKRVSQGEELLNPQAYFMGVARLLVLEIHKERAKERQAMGELAQEQQEAYTPEDVEPRVEC
ncbi:MAG TPA: hypothetical protein VG778_03235, partial [Blastocatellia bacterium]|nr:hypothetical protein [Blastocatellia bacterium]